MAVLNFKLYAICFLDAMVVGLFLPILSTHIFSLGGTHTTLGILGTFHAALQLISGPLAHSWKDTLGKKFALLFTLFISFASYLPLGITTSTIIVILLRLVFALTNQTQTLCQSFALEHNSPEKHDNVYNVMNAATVAGYVAGPIIGGMLYEWVNGFFYITMLASLVTAVCLSISLTLPSSPVAIKEKRDKSCIQRIDENFRYSVDSLQSINFAKQWDAVLLKCLYHFSITIFFIKFSLLLRFHYNASFTSIGYTYAYQSILTFLSHFIVAVGNQRFPESSRSLLSSLVVVLISFAGLCYAPTYDMYLISFIPMIVAHTMLTSSWKALFKLRSLEEHNIEAAENVLTKTIAVVAPIVFGIFCDLYGHYALKTVVILPLICDIIILLRFTSDIKPVTVNEKKD